MINDNKKETDNEKQIAKIQKNRSRPTHEFKYTKKKLCLSIQSVTTLCSVGKCPPKTFFAYSALIMATLKGSTG